MSTTTMRELDLIEESWWGRVPCYISIICLALMLNGCALADWLKMPPLSEDQQAAYNSLTQQAELTEAAADPVVRYNRARDAIATLKAQIMAIPGATLPQDLKDAAAVLRVLEKKAKRVKEEAVAALFAQPFDPVAARTAEANFMKHLLLMEAAISDTLKEIP